LDRGLFQRLRFLQRPPGLLAVVVVLGAVTAASVYGWAWYHFIAGQRAMARFESEPARAHFQQCLRIWPHNSDALLLMARAERRLGQFAQAQQHLDQCREHADPEIAQGAAFEWALLRAAAGDLGPVEQSLQTRILKRPDEAPLIWEALAEGYRRTYRMPEALNSLDTWLHFEPENVQAHFLRGEVHRQVGAINRARENYSKVVELDPRHDTARGHLARCLVEVGRYQDAMQHLEVLLQKSPEETELLTLKARSEYDLGRRDDAVRLLDEVVGKHPDYGPALRERGRVALAAEQFADAERWYRQALETMPFNYEVNWGLQQALRGLGQTAKAEEQLAVAQQLKDRIERIHEIRTHEMTLHPRDAALHAELGELLALTGQREMAEYWLLSALQLDPKLPQAHAALARLYDEQGNAAAAELHRQQAGEAQKP